MKLFLIMLTLCCGLGVSEASAALTIDDDNRSVDFGRMEPGETKQLSRSGVYHNEITCTATGSTVWYLKVQLFAPLTSGRWTIPASNLQWYIDSTSGVGQLTYPRQYVPFSTTPNTVYVSTSDEASGTPVSFRFKYRLTLPQHQVAGVYQTTIRYTLSEAL